jgi:hypothetical protein
MKGIHALLVAAGLGVVGMLFNYAYLSKASQKLETVSFIGMNQDVNRGEKLKQEYFVEVAIPVSNVGNLKEYVVLYQDRTTVVNVPVWRTLKKGSLLTRDATEKTPPQSPDLKEGERLEFIPIDVRTTVPSLIVPGAMVSFRVARPEGVPTRAVRGDAGSADPAPKPGDAARTPEMAPAGGSSEVIGPFKVICIGNRLSSAEVMTSYKLPQLQENMLGIRVSKHEGNEVQKYERLCELLQATNSRQVGVTIHSPKDKEGN